MRDVLPPWVEDAGEADPVRYNLLEEAAQRIFPKRGLEPSHVWRLKLALHKLSNTRRPIGGITPMWHPYNETWRNERQVEVPLGLAEVRGTDPRRVLEVGNVLRHYQSGLTHDCVDLFEEAPGILNVDACDFKGGPYERIVSLSTIEHIGLEDGSDDPSRSVKAARHLVDLLDKRGEFLATWRAGYNPALDESLKPGFGLWTSIDVVNLARRVLIIARTSTRDSPPSSH